MRALLIPAISFFFLFSVPGFAQSQGAVLSRSAAQQWTLALDTRSASGRNTALTFRLATETSVFVNGALWDRLAPGPHSLPLDSLCLTRGAFLFFVFQGGKPEPVAWAEPHWENTLDPWERTPPVQADFMVMASVLLAAAALLLYRASPQLAFDYFNVTRMFSFYERETSRIAGRLTTSLNLLYLFFICAFTASLVVVLQMQPFTRALLHWPDALSFSRLPEAVGAWLLVATAIFLLLLLKRLWVVAIARLFGVDGHEIQFLQSVRIILFISLLGIIAILVSGWVGAEAAARPGALSAVSAILLMGILLLFVKLQAREAFPISYLFFYLCITEVIPFIILIKVSFQ